MRDYREVNRVVWDERAPAHAASPDYAVSRLVDDPSFISRVVSFDLPRLGDVAGLRGVHLQCHIGTDTVSLARLGARMTGLDFSSASITEARQLAQLTGVPVDFVQGDVYQAVELLGAEAFDLVFTGVGALCWLPDIRRWAEVVVRLLRPGGRLHLREGHPVLWALEDARSDGALVLEHPYFERPEPLVWNDPGSYVETEVAFAHTVTHVWNHGLGETVTALLDAGMRLTMLVEHDSVPWEALPGQMERLDNGEWRLADRPLAPPPHIHPAGGQARPLSSAWTPPEAVVVQAVGL
jgi:SAM-dependent methyltransferase